MEWCRGTGLPLLLDDEDFTFTLQLERGHADLAVRNFACTFERSQVVLCPHAVKYVPYFFWTRFPLQRTKMWNLVRLLTPTSWLVTLIALSVTVICLKIAYLIGRKMEVPSISTEIVLCPYRYKCKQIHIDFLQIALRFSILDPPASDTFFNKGFSSNFLFLTWAILGGLLK